MIVFSLSNTFRILEYSVSNNLLCRMIFPVGLTWFGYLILCVFVLLLCCILIEISDSVLKRLPRSLEQKQMPEIHYTLDYNQQYLSQSMFWKYLKSSKLKYALIYTLISLLMVVSYARII